MNLNWTKKFETYDGEEATRRAIQWNSRGYAVRIGERSIKPAFGLDGGYQAVTIGDKLYSVEVAGPAGGIIKKEVA